MDAQMVLSTARSGTMPDHWHAWPLRKDFVLRSALKWAVAGVLLLAIFALVVSSTVPYNFQHGGTGAAIFSVVLIALVGTAAFGGLGITIYDLWRIANAGHYLLVMTPEDYVKEEPRKITHVPMENVAYITLRGVKSPEMQAYEEAGGGRESRDVFQSRDLDRVTRAIGGANQRRLRAQTPTLAFLDTRTDKEVIVATDASFDELPALEYVLKLEMYENERRHNART
ncbi:MAG TPA: hypothetical protein VJQ45_05465 [Ktedonobacterales bacterium]|nr:hypothetical protein [Ktedonobacterales bacterium]